MCTETVKWDIYFVTNQSIMTDTKRKTILHKQTLHQVLTYQPR